MAVLRSLTCAAVMLPLLQENNLSNSIPHRVKSRTEAVKHLSPSLETWEMLKIILLKLKFINEQNQWYHTKLCFNINLALCGLPSNMKSSSHKRWQTSLTSQNTKPKEKEVGGTWHIMSPRLKKWGVTSPVSSTKLRPCFSVAYFCVSPKNITDYFPHLVSTIWSHVRGK